MKHRPRPATEGTQARVKAEQDLERTRAETPKYAELGRDLREIRERNHLALAFIHAAKGRRA